MIHGKKKTSQIFHIEHYEEFISRVLSFCYTMKVQCIHSLKGSDNKPTSLESSLPFINSVMRTSY